MFIERIEVERFGSLRNVTVGGLGPGVQVLHGTNETGKTSLLEFVRAVFFGFEGLFRRGVLDPQVPCAGRLVVVAGSEGRRISIERRHEGPHLASLTQASYEDDIVGLGGDDGDLIKITDLDPSPEHRGRIYLQDLVGEIDETAFTNVMAFGLDELHELRTLDPEGCGSRLYELAAGLDRSKVSRVLNHLRNALARLDATDPAVSPIESLRQRRTEILQRLASLKAPALTAGGLAAELARVDAEIASLEAAIARAEEAENVIRRVVPLESLHHEMLLAAERLVKLEGAALVHPDRDTWKRAVRRRDRLVREAARRKKSRSRRARELKAVSTESSVWQKRSIVAGLLEEEPRLERLMAEVSRLESHARLAARRFGEQIGMAGLSRLVPVERAVDAAGDASAELLLPEGFALSFAPLHSRARACSRASREVSAARRAVADAKGELDTTRGVVSGAGTHLGGMTIAEAIEEATGRGSAIRNRIAVAKRIDELDESLSHLEGEVANSMEGQLLPLGWLIPLGCLFVVGAGMLLSGLLLPTSVTGTLAYAIAALGLAGTGLASVTTWSLDRAASTRLEAVRQQYDMVNRQREDAATQLAQLDAAIPGDTTQPLDRKLAAIQAEVERLEGLAGREGSMHVLSDRLTIARQELKRAIAHRKSSRLRWRRSLEQRGLPATLMPRDVRMIEMHRQSLLTLDDDRRRLSEEARQKRDELAEWSHRIDQVMVECDLVPEGSPLDHLRLLRERLEADGRAVRLRATATRRLERARSRHRQALKQIKLADRGIQQFYSRWDVATEQEFLAKVDRRPLYRQARRDAEAAEAAWVEARRAVTEPHDLEHWLAETATLPLEKRLGDACAATDRLRESLLVAEDRRTVVAKRLDAATRDRSSEPLQAELASVEQELAAQLDRRRLLERAGLLLEETRAVVARDHQPPTLRDASHWLARLTDGRYTRITTTIDEARLEVHESDGQVWPPERLSRGTREQVFLALRLALVRDLQRHGVMLPVVMDDALVNFDDGRAQAAARVLMEFVSDQPRERQLLALTCHAHVASLFAAVHASVRSLSDPAARWAAPALPRPAAVTPQPAVTIVPTPAAPAHPPQHVAIVAETSGGSWAAEEFFFGGGQPATGGIVRVKKKPTARRS